MTNFYNEVELIEGEAKVFIDESFRSLRSAEGAFDMLLNFRHIKSRAAINNQLMNKFKDILVQYLKEVWTTTEACGLSVTRASPGSQNNSNNNDDFRSKCRQECKSLIVEALYPDLEDLKHSISDGGAIGGGGGGGGGGGVQEEGESPTPLIKSLMGA